MIQKNSQADTPSTVANSRMNGAGAGAATPTITTDTATEPEAIHTHALQNAATSIGLMSLPLHTSSPRRRGCRNTNQTVFQNATNVVTSPRRNHGTAAG